MNSPRHPAQFDHIPKDSRKSPDARIRSEIHRSLSDVAARLLTKAGGRLVAESELQRDVEAGAPTNPDGTINLLNFTAWRGVTCRTRFPAVP